MEKNKINNNIYILNDTPGIPITEQERALKLLEYSDMALSKKEEETFRNKESASYSVRMDTDIIYKDKMYYRKFYLSKDTIVEKNEKGVFSSSGIYITPSELRAMGKEGLISVETKEKGVFKEYDDGTTIIHWSTPLANLYYENENNKNNTIQINDYTYNTMLIRNFEFNPFKFYNKYIADNTFYKNGSVDEFLIKVLLEKKEKNELTDIIFTIQGNQNKIIRTNSKENFIVQGCAGSGKTMILLHRLSYLKFNNKLPSYDKIKIITPNQLFSNFIANLTKDLSIQNIEQITMDKYYMFLNSLYIERYNKIEEIDKKYYQNHKERVKKEFSIENLFDEYEFLNNKIGDIYSYKLFNIINIEYNKLINSFNQELTKINLGIENQYSSNYIYYEQVIKNITKKINALSNSKDNIRRDYTNTENNIKYLEEKINKLNQETINNNKTIEEIHNKRNKIEKEIDELINKKIIFKRNNISIDGPNYKIYDLQLKMHQNIKLKHSKILEENKTLDSIKNKIKILENVLDKLNEEKIQNIETIKEINDKCNNIKKEMESKIKKKKVFLQNMRNSTIFKEHYDLIKLEYKKIQNLNSRQLKILEEHTLTLKEKDELTHKLQEYKLYKGNENKRKIHLKDFSNFSLINKLYENLNLEYNKIENINLRQSNIIQELGENEKEKYELEHKLQDYENEKNLIQQKISNLEIYKNTVLDKVFFTIDIYKNIISKIRNKFSLSVPSNMFSKIDLLIFLCINYLHIGSLINGDELLCIDEAQNYSEIEIEILNRVNPNVVMNLYGDTKQSIYNNGIYDWNNLIQSLNFKKYVINENYRNPIEITNYCNKKFNYNILGMGLSIKPVEIIKESQIHNIINEKISQNKTIAIISKDEFLNKINNKLVSYCNIQDVKGIEYNTVIVNDKNMSKNEKYIAYTRALSELYILNS